MPLLHIIILALVQGITEFLPISSSGHLILAHNALGQNLEPEAWDDMMMMDIAVHVGTLFSVLVYFRSDLCDMVSDIKTIRHNGLNSKGGKLARNIIISSLPVILAGFVLFQLNLSILRSLEIVAWMTLIFGGVLWAADRYYPAKKTIDSMSIKDAFLIGLAQSFALIPGTSRSGVTMSASRALGYSRPESARYSMLLAIVAIAGAGTLSVIDLLQAGNASLSFSALIAAVLAFVSGWVAISLMMRWLQKFNFTPFVIYRVLLAVALLVGLYSGVLS
jgi:undecaprenyl-diphosphatase